VKVNWKKCGLTLLASSAVFLASCAPGGQQSGDTLVDGDELTIPYVPWETEIASTHVMGEVLTQAGYDVNLVSADLAIIFESIASGQADATFSVWMPESQADLWNEHEENFTHIGTSMEGAKVGLAVPEYMDVNSIEELNDQAGQEIIGIEAGAGVVQGAQQAVESYDNLEDWSVTTSSSGAMTTELDNAISNEEEIVVTGWSPHWKFLVHDLKYLEDPQGVFGEAESIETIGRLGLEEDHPVAYSILENFNWDVADMEAVMLDMQEGATAEDAASTWVEENQDKVQEWTADAGEIAQEQTAE